VWGFALGSKSGVVDRGKTPATPEERKRKRVGRCCGGGLVQNETKKSCVVQKSGRSVTGGKINWSGQVEPTLERRRNELREKREKRLMGVGGEGSSAKSNVHLVRRRRVWARGALLPTSGAEGLVSDR